MKNLLLFGALAHCLNSFAQITFSQILSFEGKTSNEVQGFLLKNYSLISQAEKVYFYEQIQEFDDSPQYLEDNCTWYGGQIIETLRRNSRTTRPEFKNSSIKNYSEKIYPHISE